MRNKGERLEGPESLRRFNTIPKHKSGKARIEAPSVKGKAHRPHTEALGSSAQALRFMLISQEPRGGQERKQDSEDDPDINAHQSSPAAALPTNSSLTDAIYFDDLVAQAPERKPVPSSPRHCRDVAHAQTGLAQTRRFLFLFQPAAPPTALSAAFPASVISYSMFCMLGDCDERLI